ncbi:restriction endonuclease subunit S [Providencia manganoxydans]|uniref:restriction endonuclease subunit S n=1 Tax=Providencia manganoxydans TaxID=2923283 RepID=UPI0034E5B446
MSEWQNTTLGDVITLHYGKALKTQNRIVGNIPVYSSAGITGYHNEPLVMSKGIIIGRKGTVGKVYYSPEPFWCIDTAYYVLPNETKYDFIWLYYQLGTIGLEELNEDSAVPGLNRTTAYSQDILIPSIAEQKAIASVLSSLDDKIDLLHRQNKTLESMAETLFRQWFVEEAQDDWEEKTLADFGKVVCGKTPSKKKSEYYGNDIPFLKIPDMHGRVFISSTEDNLSLLGAESQLNKLLPEGSLCVSCIATVGLVCITSKPMQTNQQINSIIPKSSKYLYFLFLLMKSINDELHSLASGGTTTLNLNTGNFSKIKICVPPKEDIFSFNQSVYDFFEKIKSNTKQIQTLENLRDTLLPKLMSGEVRVSYTPEEIKQ